MKTVPAEEFKRMYGEIAMSQFIQPVQPESFIRTAGNFVGGVAKQGLKSLLVKPAARTTEALGRGGLFGEKIKRGFEEQRTTGQKVLGFDIEPVKTGISGAKQIAGEGLEAASWLIPAGRVGAVVQTGLKQGITQGAKVGARSGAVSGGTFEAGSALQEDQDALGVTGKAVIGAGAGLLGGAVVGGSIPGVIKGVQKGAELTTKGVQKGIETATKVTKGAKDFAKGTRDVAQMVVEEGVRVPRRIATNVAEKQAIRQQVQSLPTRIAREAAQDGLEVRDVDFIYKIPKEQKTPLKKLAESVRRFAKGESRTDPIEVVGKPIVNRIKELESAKSSVGKKLGEVANSLGNVSAKEIFPAVLSRLQKVPGLSGLRVSKKGLLDFSDTVLASSETKADRMAIQRIFLEAVKGGTGKSKHLFRQELFEVLGGKKRAQLNLTDTQEKAYEAIRSGLSDVLESKNKSYKILSSEYRKIIKPVQEMRKLLKAEKVDEDVLDMSAGLLARRITSLASTNPQIRSVLKSMDEATKKKGTTRLSVETLQDFYNILEKYYDIAPKTGFQSQIRRGVEKATSFGDLAFKQVEGLTGETPAVRQEALERVFKEVFK